MPRGLGLALGLALVLLAAAATAAFLVPRAEDRPPATSESVDPSTPTTAADFHDSIGLNVHNNNTDTAYAEWPRAVRALRMLGVRHVRDGLKARRTGPGRAVMRDQIRRLRVLRKAGIRAQFIVGSPGKLGQEGSVRDLLRFVRRDLLGVTAGLEGPNEFDINAPPRGFARRLRAWQTELFRRTNADARLRDLPVVGPSIVHDTGRAELGDVSDAVDLGNIHPYPGGRPPGGDHLRGEIERGLRNAPGRRLQATETGYHDLSEDENGQPGVSPRAVAAYVPRLFLEHHVAGIQRTYLFQLIDEKRDPARRRQEEHFGLLRNDFTTKPAFHAVARLLAATKDASARGAVAVAEPVLEGDGEALGRVDLTRSDGGRLVILWLRKSAFDLERRRDTRPERRHLVLRTDGQAVARHVIPLDPAQRVSRPLAPGPATRVRVGADPRVIAFAPPGRAEALPRLPRRLVARHVPRRIPVRGRDRTG